MTKTNIAHQHDDDHDQIEATSDSTTKRKFETYNQIHTNLMLCALARERQVKLNWVPANDGYRVCELSPELQLMVSPEATQCRAPTGLDIDLLFLVLRTAWTENVNIVSLSRLQIIEELKLTNKGSSYQYLEDGFELWTHTSIHHRRWVLSRKERRKYDSKRTDYRVLPPPFTVTDDGQGLSIRIATPWLKLPQEGNYEQVPASLPHHSATLNLGMFILATKITDDQGFERTEPFTVGQLCARSGLSTRARRRDLPLMQVTAWFKQHGGILQVIDEGYRIAFRFERPKLAKSKRQQQLTQIEEPTIKVKSLPRHRLAPKRHIRPFVARDEYPRSSFYDGYDTTGIELE